MTDDDPRSSRTAANLNAISLEPGTPLAEAVDILRKNALIVLVVEPDGRLAGVLTDGDLRRALLRGVDLEAPVREAMNIRPLTAPAGRPRSYYFDRMRNAAVFHLPILDAENRLVDLATLAEQTRKTLRSTPVVIMAGGLGTRLHPLTEATPKPMLPIAGRPLLQIILERLIAQNFGRFWISVNHLSEIIEQHFRDGSPLGVEVSYIRETKRLGTAGALSLVSDSIEEPLIVMNGDILTDLDFGALLDFHKETGAVATMALNVYRSEVPFGVVDVDGTEITRIEEKPELKFLVNAGIYVVSPEAVREIPENAFYDMPTLFQKLQSQSAKLSGFPIHESWLDIGRPHDLERATAIYSGENP
jgi:dTDP-glucose pyrophosphorylase/CBS domain-containing protein